jgi:hypothetical protein
MTRENSRVIDRTKLGHEGIRKDGPRETKSRSEIRYPRISMTRNPRKKGHLTWTIKEKDQHF